jgi:peptidoglycan/LPS O-acetylase OafA/YrhL
MTVRPKTHRGNVEVDPRFRNRERQPGLDLLRALAIIVVVVYHAALFGFKLPGRVDRFGWIGVDLFFVLSGYLIGGQLLASLARDRRINLGRFFVRRALRIMPAYLVVLAIYFLLPSWREYSEMSQPLWKFLLSVQNIALHGGTAFSHAWSLAVEDQFYLALPFLLLFLFRRPRAAIIVPCLIVLGGIALRAFLAAQNPSVDGGGVSFRGFQAWIYYPTWTRLDPLVFGVALAAIEKFRPNWWQRLINCAPWLWLPALGLLSSLKRT